MSATREELRYKDAETDEDIFLEACERQKIAEENEAGNRTRAIEAIAFENGAQWPTDIYNQRSNVEKRPTLTINQTGTVCRRQANQLRQQRPSLKCQPTGGGSRIEDAEVITGLMRHIQVQSNASVAYDQGGECAIKGGWGYWRIVGEYTAPDSFDQELVIKPVWNQFQVYDDPLSLMPAGEDRMWLLITEDMSRREYERRYRGSRDDTEWGPTSPGDENALRWSSQHKIRLAEYFRIREVADTLVLMSDGRGWFKSMLPSEETMLAGGFRPQIGRDGKWITRPTARRQVQWFRINGTKVKERRDLPGRWIPVIRCEGNKTIMNGNVYRKGIVEDLMDPARMYNYWRSSETERYALAPKAPWVMAEGQDEGHPEWDDANTRSYSRLVYKPATDDAGNTLPPPQRQPATPIEQGFAQAAQSAMMDFQTVAGMPMENPEIQARVVGGNKYLQRRQGMQDLTHFNLYDNQTYSVMWTGIILLDLIPHYYDTRRMQRIIGVDGEAKMVEINVPSDDPKSQAIYRIKSNMETGRYDVVVDPGPDYKTLREEGAEGTMNLLGANQRLGDKITDVASDLIVRGMNFPGAQDIADRLAPTTPEGMQQVLEGLPKQAQAIVISLQAQIKQRDELLQQQALEIKYGMDKEKLRQSGEDRRKAADIESRNKQAEIKDDTTRHVTEVESITRRDVAEIGAAAQLLNSQQESRSEERMADKMIKRGVEQ